MREPLRALLLVVHEFSCSILYDQLDIAMRTAVHYIISSTYHDMDATTHMSA